MSIYHLDFETYSPQPLVGPKGVGAFRYAVDPETEILIMAIAKDDGPVRVWDSAGCAAVELLEEAIESGALIYAHNAQFEHAICHYLLKKTFGIRPPKPSQWRCTAAMARLAAIPSSLEDCGAFLDLDVQKDKEGKRLIDKFSTPRRPTRKDPRTRVMPRDDPEDFDKFVEYCVRDVEVEREIHKRLEKDFPLEGWALDSFQLDMEMNTAGIPVNRAALEHANTLMGEYLDRLVPVFRKQVAEEGGTRTLPVTKQRKQPKEVDITDGFNPSQGELFKVWLADEGFTGGNLQADTQEDWLENWKEYGLTERGRAALHTYSLVASAAVKKIPAMLKLACPDDMVRGGLQVFGAERTHRWAGRGIQPQNFARPKIKFTELAYQMLCSGATLDEIEDLCGDFFDVLVSVLRHFIQPHGGAMVLQADYSAIEARVAPWLVGEQKKLDLFAKGEPIYEIMAQRIFGGKVEDITQDQRFIGKQAELGCTYNMGVPKFRATCEGYGFTPPQEMVEEYCAKNGMDPQEYEWEDLVNATYDDLAERAVYAWRAANPIIVKSWRDLEKAAKFCINNPGTIKTVGQIKFIYKKVAGFKALLAKLPSGHKLVYPKARIVEREDWGEEIQFWGILPQTGGKNWGWCSTYGGKLLENLTQSAAGDVMREGMKSAWAEGYRAFMLVHDELLTIQRDPSQTHERLCELLCKKQKWMTGLPLAAEGSIIPFYKK